MSKCPTCQSEMKPLFVGEYCPNDCDRPRVTMKSVTITKNELQEAISRNTWTSGWVPAPQGVFPFAPPPPPSKNSPPPCPNCNNNNWVKQAAVGPVWKCAPCLRYFR